MSHTQQDAAACGIYGIGTIFGVRITDVSFTTQPFATPGLARTSTLPPAVCTVSLFRAWCRTLFHGSKLEVYCQMMSHCSLLHSTGSASNTQRSCLLQQTAACCGQLRFPARENAAANSSLLVKQTARLTNEYISLFVMKHRLFTRIRNKLRNASDILYSRSARTPPPFVTHERPTEASAETKRTINTYFNKECSNMTASRSP